MMRILPKAVVAILVISFSLKSSHARELYVVQGFARGAPISADEVTLWTSDALLFNASSQVQRVRLLGISNGGHGGDPGELELPPQRTASFARLAPTWTIGGPDPLWVVSLDVPDVVKVESVLFVGSANRFIGEFPVMSGRPGRFGKVRLPVVAELQLPNDPQVFLGTYLGSPIDMPSRLNVAIFNGGEVLANARVEVRQHCDDSVVESRVVSVPADTLLQFSGFSAVERGCPPFQPGTLGGSEGAMYVVVTVDQPSFAFVSNLSNAAIPTTSMAITTSP